MQQNAPNLVVGDCQQVNAVARSVAAEVRLAKDFIAITVVVDDFSGDRLEAPQRLLRIIDGSKSRAARRKFHLVSGTAGYKIIEGAHRRGLSGFPFVSIRD